jgi:hypothetical protein
MKITKEMTKPLLRDIKAVLEQEKNFIKGIGEKDAKGRTNTILNIGYVVILRGSELRLAVEPDSKPLVSISDTLKLIRQVQLAKSLGTLTKYNEQFPSLVILLIDKGTVNYDPSVTTICKNINYNLTLLRNGILNLQAIYKNDRLGYYLTDEQLVFAKELANKHNCVYSDYRIAFSPKTTGLLGGSLLGDHDWVHVLKELERVNGYQNSLVSKIATEGVLSVTNAEKAVRKLSLTIGNNVTAVSIASDVYDTSLYLLEDMKNLKVEANCAKAARLEFIAKYA